MVSKWWRARSIGRLWGGWYALPRTISFFSQCRLWTLSVNLIRWNILVTLFVTICLTMMIWWDKDDNCMLRAMFYRGVFICVHLKLRMYYSALFALPCRPYTCQLWSRYTARSLHKLYRYVAYNNAFRMMHHLPTYCSASEMFTVNRVPNCAAVIRNLTFKFMSRLGLSSNAMVCSIIDSDLKFVSRIRLHWMNMLYMGQNFKMCTNR